MQYEGAVENAPDKRSRGIVISSVEAKQAFDYD